MRRSFEGGPSFSSVEREVDEEAKDKEAYGKAVEALDKDAIKERGFADLYGEENVQRDLARVEAAEADFKQTETPQSKLLKQYSTIFEWIVNQRVELSDYFGPNAFTKRASRYDDIVNGVDTILEFRNDPEQSKKASYLTLGIDDTFSTNQDVQEKKLRRIQERITRGELARVKYFSSDYLNFRGELKNVPLIILGSELKTVAELRDLMLSGDNSGLDAHPIQNLLLHEARVQIEAFSRYANGVGRGNLAEIYGNSGHIIEEVIAQKPGFDEDALSQDRVFQAMRAALENVFTTK
ncbi:MAG: hypothetical protein M1312_00080 [Patescibacteria group bacterium]|nr:hypothetical protein [Patescibacteria group bacterium]